MCARVHYMWRQGGRSWRASGDHQISLTALARSACLQIFATKTPYFTIANFCNINVVIFYNFVNKICNGKIRCFCCENLQTRAPG